MAPLIQALAKYRLPHLLGACSFNASLGAVELEARPLEGQFREVEDPTDAALEIVHHVLMKDAQHPARQHRIPMLHECEIGAVVAGDVIYAVNELLAARVQLLEVSEAARHRLAAGVDDL